MPPPGAAATSRAMASGRPSRGTGSNSAVSTPTPMISERASTSSRRWGYSSRIRLRTSSLPMINALASSMACSSSAWKRASGRTVYSMALPWG